jgi:hypothetical protein
MDDTNRETPTKEPLRMGESSKLTPIRNSSNNTIQKVPTLIQYQPFKTLSLRQSYYDSRQIYIDRRLTLLPIPNEIQWYTSEYLNKEKFKVTQSFIERDLKFWMHEMEVDYDWLHSTIGIQEFIDYPHEHRQMKIPVFGRKIVYFVIQ